jgi:hypothetical protein
MKVFMPKDQVFYALFEDVADNVYSMGKALKAVVSEVDFHKRDGLIAGLENQEHHAFRPRGHTLPGQRPGRYLRLYLLLR